MKTRNPITSTRPEPNVLIFFFIYILLMSGAPVAMRITYSEMGPFFMGFLRFGLGSLIFWILVFFKRLQIPNGQALIGPLLYGILGIGISFALLAWGLVKTPTSLAAIFLALVPMLTVILSALQRVEPITSRSIFGSLFSIVGTIVAVGAASSYGLSIIHIGALILGTVFLAQGSIALKRYPPNPPIMTNALAMSVGAIILGIISLVSGESWAIPLQPRTWVALSYLVFFVSIVGFLLYLKVLKNWTASATSYGFVIIPFITVIISALITREQITLKFLLGLVLVITGAIIGALLPSKVKITKECATC